jgi:uncharacterized protein (TIGR03437 family)
MVKLCCGWLILASLLLSGCLRRVTLNSPGAPAVAPSKDAKAEGAEPREHRETPSEHWSRLRAYKHAAARTLAMRARLGMKDPAAPQTAPGTAADPFTWTFLGPQPIGTGNPANPFSGSIRDIVLDHYDSATIYVVTFLGKIWKTTNSGATWAPLLDYGSLTAVDALVADPVLPNTLYVENGDLLRSTDGGQTWQQLPAVAEDSAQDCATYAFAVSPTGGTWLALEMCPTSNTQSGVYRSTDAGKTWTLVFTPSAAAVNWAEQDSTLLSLGDSAYLVGDLRFNSGSSSYAYLAIPTYPGVAAYVSTDGGATWSDKSPQVEAHASATEVHMLGAPSSPTTLFLLAGGYQTAGFTSTLLKSSDGGTTWQTMSDLPNDFGSPRPPSLLAVHPTDPTLVFFGSVQFYRSTDGGNSWANMMTIWPSSSIHTDQHALVFTSDAQRLYESSDGGIWTATEFYADFMDWTSLNYGLGTAEFYAPIAVDAQNPSHVLGGTQDNSTLVYCCSAGASWVQTACGDGLSTAIDPTNSANAYTTCNGGVFKSYTGGQPGGWTQLTAGLPDLADDWPILALDNLNPSNVYLIPGGTGFYQSQDGGNSWRAMGSSLKAVNQIAVSPANSNVVYVAASGFGATLSTTANALAATPVWTSSTLPSANLVYPLGVAPDPKDATKAAVLLGVYEYAVDSGQYVLAKTTDQGATWQTSLISFGDPNFPYANDTNFYSSIAADPDIPNVLYILKDLSAYRSSDGGATWYPLASGLPLVAATGISVHQASRTLWVGTQGRGMWNLSIPTSAPRLSSVAATQIAPATASSLTVTGVNFDGNSTVLVNGAAIPTTFVGSTELTANASASTFPIAAYYYISVSTPGSGGGLSDPVALAIGVVLNAGGLVSSADPTVTQLVPGALMSIYGANLAPSSVLATLPLPSSLNEVQVLINGVAAPLVYVSPTQINFVVPWEVDGQTSATVMIQNGGMQSSPLQAAVAVATPAIFTINAQGQGAILIANTSIIAAPAGAFPNSRPAQAGEYIEIYATGLGTVNQTPEDGQAPGGADPVNLQSIYVVWYTSPSQATANMPVYTGLAPGFPGLYQIDVQVPTGLSGNAVPIAIYSYDAGGVHSSQVTLAIQ